MTEEQTRALAELKQQSDNIQSQLSKLTEGRLNAAVLSLPASSATDVTPVNPPSQTFTVNPWVALVIAALIPVTAAIATQVTGVAAIVVTSVGAALTGVAAFLGMKVGAPK